jgi:alkaline phosphatase D
MKRRDFLRSSGWFVVGAALVGIPGCGDNGKPGVDAGNGIDPVGTYGYPQGVASGDPQSTSVVLWTRVVRSSDATADVTVGVQVSADPGFTTMLVNQTLTATTASDHTVRVLVTGLGAATDYYYRFLAGQDMKIGQTRTAPTSDADVQVNLAWVSCQDYGAGTYGAYRQMLVDDLQRADADKIHAVVHVGDMIYETRADGFQGAVDDNFNPVNLTNSDGSMRQVPAFPSGGGTRAGVTFAKTIDDYRHLYKTFFSDPDIQAARARWPFIATWDDHEFTDDCWQSQANYTDAMGLDEGDQSRKVVANQAWFEYVPAQLTGVGGVTGVPSQAKDFAAPSPAVVDAMFPTTVTADNFVDEPNNVAAVGSIAIYRSLRFGQHVELVMTDQRSYRSDHAIPEDIVAAAATAAPGLFFAPRNAVPQLLVDQMDAGATANGGNPLAMIGPIPNPRTASPPGTMLGKDQKAWWKATMKGSDATWKLWGNEVTLMRLRIPKLDSPTQMDLSNRVVSADAWDGYPSERNELMGYLKAEAIKNVVVLSGDIHASFAGLVMDNFDATAPAPVPVACELVAAGISSNSLFSFFESATRQVPASLRSLITVDASATGGPKFVENFNLLLAHGLKSAGTFAGTVGAGADVATALASALMPANVDATINTHVKYFDSNAQGYGYVKVTKDQVAAQIITINRPVMAPTDAGPGIKRTASFTIPKDNPGGMSAVMFGAGDVKPFPLT